MVRPSDKEQDMAKYQYTWLLEYYGEGCMIKRKYIDASTKAEALDKARKSLTIVELICCVRVDKW